jgi:hypothetical protein
MPHLPPAHYETSKHDSPSETKIKEKQNKIVLDSNSNLAKSMTHHNQTKERITWFLSPAPPDFVQILNIGQTARFLREPYLNTSTSNGSPLLAFGFLC